MKFIVDMNISPLTRDTLRSWEFDVIRVSDVLPATALDCEIIEYAKVRGYVLVTFDLDFSALLAVGGHQKPSLISLRISNADPIHIANRLAKIINTNAHHLESGSIITVEDSAIRVRSLPLG